MFSALIGFFAAACIASEVVELNPPILSESSCLEKIVCERPLRKEKINISISYDEGKTIVNNYGHGGSGYTTLFGTVHKALQLFEETHPIKDEPIMVVGSGVVGLATAIELKRAGYNVKGIQTKERYDIASYKAGGILALSSVSLEPSINEMALEHFLMIKKIMEGSHPYLSPACFNHIDTYTNCQESGLEYLVSSGLIPEPEEVTLKFGSIERTGFKKYQSILIHVSQMMQELSREVDRLEIPLFIEEACCFGCVDANTIFNCSGLGSQILNEDDKMVSVRGHLIALNENAGTSHLNYCIFGEFQGKYFYMIPKTVSVSLDFPEGRRCYGVLGGTFIPKAADLSKEDQETLDQTSFEEVLKTNQAFFGS